MVDVDDAHEPLRLIDLVPDAVLAAVGAPQADEGLAQRSADAVRSLAERTVAELPRGEHRGRRQELNQGSAGAGDRTRSQTTGSGTAALTTR